MPTVSGEVGKPVAGKNEVYELTYTVEDKDGNRREVVRKVTVTNQVPRISGLNAMAVTEGASRCSCSWRKVLNVPLVRTPIPP